MLTPSFELDVERWSSGYSWQRSASNYDLAHGGLLPIGLLVMLCALFLATAVRRSRPTPPRP